jgi:hypothetical protein
VSIVAGENDDLARAELERLLAINLYFESSFNHVVVKDQMRSRTEKRRTILGLQLRRDAPRLKELGVQEYTASKVCDPQDVR